MHWMATITKINSLEGTLAQGKDAHVGQQVFCAIRYGDSMGLKERIVGLNKHSVGHTIVMQGEYIDKSHAFPSHDNPDDPVIHFTHHPVGDIVYNGKKYE